MRDVLYPWSTSFRLLEEDDCYLMNITYILREVNGDLYLCTFRFSQFKLRKVRIKSQPQCRIGIAHEANRAHDDDGDAGFPAGPVQC